MTLTQVNYAFDPALRDPGELLEAYHTLTGWSDAVAAAGASVTVVQAFSTDATIERDGIRYLFRKTGGSRAQRVGAVHAAVLASEPDVVHVNGLDVPLQTWRLRRCLPSAVALVVQDHGAMPPGPRQLRTRVRRRLMRPVDGFLFTARAQAEPWIDQGLIGGGRKAYDVLEASTSLQPIDRAQARALTSMTGDPAVLWVGRLDENKDPLTVLAAMEQTLAARPGATLTMVFSDDRLLPAVRARIAAVDSLARAVRHVGRVPHDRMPAFFSAADLFVLGSRREACGYALLEACACGATPVVSDIAAFRAVTGDGTIGVLWPAGSARACAAALTAAANDDLDRARARVRAHFDRHASWQVVGQRALRVYASVLEQRRRGRERPQPRATLAPSPCRAEQPTSNASSTTERPSSMR
jgi:glycosyltransferase involved in cell wall biosynthesis